jgi:hypothetical protein
MLSSKDIDNLNRIITKERPVFYLNRHFGVMVKFLRINKLKGKNGKSTNIPTPSEALCDLKKGLALRLAALSVKKIVIFRFVPADVAKFMANEQFTDCRDPVIELPPLAATTFLPDLAEFLTRHGINSTQDLLVDAERERIERRLARNSAYGSW